MEIIKGATSNTFATIGGLVAGPGGAVAGKVIGDGVITAIDSAKSGEFTPHGFMQISPNASAGDNFDRVLEIAVTMEASRVRTNKYIFVKPQQLMCDFFLGKWAYVKYHFGNI